MSNMDRKRNLESQKRMKEQLFNDVCHKIVCLKGRIEHLVVALGADPVPGTSSWSPRDHCSFLADVSRQISEATARCEDLQIHRENLVREIAAIDNELKTLG